MDAWNAGDLDAWLELHHPDVEYVSLAAAEPSVYAGHDGLRDVWAESTQNWEAFELTVVGQTGGAAQIDFRGIERQAGGELAGTLWFRAVERDGRIERLWSALDAATLPGG